MFSRPARNRTGAAGVLACLALAGGCGGDDDESSPAPAPADSAPAAESSARVDIADFKYDPEDVTVRVGGELTWTNSDKAPHTATAEGGFDTDRLDKGDSKAIKLDKPGRVEYFCTFHRFMTATVEVVE